MDLDQRIFQPSCKANEEISKEGYCKLGLLSTLFAEMEGLIQEIISELISDDIFISSILLKRSMLEKNIELLKSMFEYKTGKTIDSNILNPINKIKDRRNQLIHGFWEIRMLLNDNSPFVIVTGHRVERIESPIQNKKGWINKSIHVYSFGDIELLIDELKNINSLLLEMKEKCLNND